MAVLLNISHDVARDLEDNFVSVLHREMKCDQARTRDIARQLIERLDLSGYQIGREQLHREEDGAVTFEGDEDFDDGTEAINGDEAPSLFLASVTANDA